MRRGSSALRGVVLALVMAAVLGTAAAQGSPEFVHAKASGSFDATVASLKKAVASNGMMVLGTLNQKGALSTTGLVLEGAESFFVGNPVAGKALFEMDAAAGAAIPLRVYVWVDGTGATEVGYFKPSDLLGGVSPEVAQMGAKMDGVFAKILAGATR